MGELLFTYLVIIIIVTLSILTIATIVWFGCDIFSKLNELIDKTADMNKPFKCRCGIVSRRHQLLNDTDMECPHCDATIYEHTNRVYNERKFPFAQKTTTYKVFKVELEKKKVNKVKVKMKNLVEYDKELESYEKLQMKKLKELEAKANEIRTELAKSGVNQ